jgi:hypothetical protein
MTYATGPALFLQYSSPVLAPSIHVRDAPGNSPPAPPGVAADVAAPKPADTPEHESLLLCAACRNPVAHPRDGIDVNGAHSHAFVNPAGMIFRLRCFSAAAGAARLGEESDYWTWFPGFLWQAAICRHCFEHLGWRYRNAEASFFGLIADRLLELRADRL